MIDVLYDNKWYNDKLVTNDSSYFIGYESIRLGMVRMRQVRMSNNSCSIPEDFAEQITTCYGTYAIGSEDKTTYGPGNSTA